MEKSHPLSIQKDMIIDGILNPKRTLYGQFAFDKKNIHTHIELMDAHTVIATDLLIEKHLKSMNIPEQDPDLDAIIRDERERLSAYVNDWCIAFFVQMDDGLKLLFTQNLDEPAKKSCEALRKRLEKRRRDTHLSVQNG
jgi:hypothetical protein